MDTLKIFVIILLSLTAFLILIFSLSGKKPMATIFLKLFSGLCLLAIIRLTTKLSGVFIPINIYTCLGCGVFGIPAIIGFLLLNIIFM